MSGQWKAVPQAWMHRRGLCHRESFERHRKCRQQRILINLLIPLGGEVEEKEEEEWEWEEQVEEEE